mmetsp:Transcript_46195/g.98851  ORF Transcript_46195/g.98851 Transcript_46195/m.98851 type:complete len:269 (-) Transcript_46195:226-1032(-)
MPGNFVGRLAVENQSEWSLTLPHPPGDVIAAAQFVGETLAVLVKEHSADATQGLSSQKLDLGIRLIRVHQAGRVDLHPLQIHCVASHAHSHLNAITSAVLTVGGWQVHEVGAVLRQQRVLREIRAKPARTQNHRSMLLEGLAILHILDTHDCALVRQKLVRLGLRHNPCQNTAASFLNLLNHLDQRIRNGHARKTLLPAVSAGSRMAAQSGNQRQIKVELVHQPVHCRPRLVNQNLRNFLLLGSARESVAQKQFIGIIDTFFLLGLGL